MPMTTVWNRAWHETPNIHPCTIHDFFDLCATEGYVVERWLAADDAGLPDDEPFRRAVREHVEFGAHVAQQNSRARTDAELHPIREVPHWNWAD